MEVAALSLSVADRIEKCVRGEVDRYKKFSRNPAVVDELYETVKRLQQQLALLDSKCKELAKKLSSDHDNLFLCLGASTVGEKLKSIQSRLEVESGKSKGAGKLKEMTRRFTKAKSTFQMLNECNNDALTIEHDVKEYYKIALAAQQAGASEAKASDVGAIDCFHASFDVEENPAHVVLYYDSMPRVGDEDNGATTSPEAQLKRAVLEASEAHGATAAVGCLGMGGVGKSCALRGLAVDDIVRKRYPDGIYMVVLGEKASKVDVVKGVTDMVKRSGGRNLAQEMCKEGGDLREVLSQARGWFEGRRVLLLVDDVWKNSELNSNIIGQLYKSVVTGQGRLVFTTRHARLASKYQTVKFGERDEMRSREILLKAAGAQADSTRSFEDVVDEVLELCAGLPLALVIAGKDVAARFRYSGGRSWCEMWMETRTAISSRRSRLVVKSDDDYDKHSVEAVCESSLETLEGGKGRRLGFEPEMSVHEMYRSLVIQKKQAAVPVGVLRRLWGMSDDCDALEAMHMFVEVSLAERRSVTLNGKETACLSVHDLQHDFVQAKCKERGEEEKYHRKLLDAWWDGAGPSREAGWQTRRDWSGSEAFDGEYMRNNLSRHLVDGGQGSELRGLLRNPRWTAKKLRRREMLGLEEDFAVAMASVEDDIGIEVSDSGTKEETGSKKSERWGLEMIAGAARLSAFFVARNPREVWFQLRGRLVGLAEKSGVIREFVEEIERYAERPWARPTWACLSKPGGPVLSIVQCAGPVEDMWRGGKEGEMRVCGLVDGMGFLCSAVNGEMEGEEVFVNKRREGCECASVNENEGAVRSECEVSVSDGCSGNCVDKSAEVEWSAVLSLRYTADGGRVVTRHANGTMRMWDGASGEAMGGTFGSYGEVCEWSADGSRVVCGGTGGRIRIRDGASGGVLGGDEHAHGGVVSCIKWWADGTRFVSGGWDGSVRIWNGASGEMLGEDKHAHGEQVNVIEWSADGSRVVSGGEDGSVKIWNVASGTAAGGDEHAHGQGVSCVEWSADGSRAVSGGHDGSIRIWDGASGEMVGGDERAHGGVVECIEWTGGCRFVSGGGDGSVKIWDGASAEAVGGDERAHCREVSCVEWSADGSRVVSGGGDGSVKIWDGASGEVAGGDERAHDGWVRCVKWSADGSRVVSGGRDGSVRTWDVLGGEAMGGSERALVDIVNCVKWSADGSQVVCGGNDGSVRIWDGASGEVLGGDVRAHGDVVCCVEWSEDGSRVVSGGDDGSVRIWDGASGEAVGGDERAHGEWVSPVKWSADGSRVLSGGGDGSVRIWDGASGEAVGGDERAHGRGVSYIEWSPDGSRVVSGGADGSVRVWDAASGEAVCGDERAHCREVRSVEWSADGTRVVSGGGDGSVRIWDGASGKAIGGDECAHVGWVKCVKWSADGSRVVSGGGDGSVKIWDGASGEAVGGNVRAHGRGVSCIEWSADGYRFVSGGYDGSVRIWDGARGEALGGDDRAHGGWVERFEWLAGGCRFVSGGREGSVRIWNETSDELVGTERRAGETCAAKWLHSNQDAGIGSGADPTSARNFGGEELTRTSVAEDGTGRWSACDGERELWFDGRRVLLATFEADHKVMRGVKCRIGKGTVVLGFLEGNSMYRVEIVK